MSRVEEHHPVTFFVEAEQPVEAQERFFILPVTKRKDLLAIKDFDDTIFGGHQGISLTELLHISRRGRVLGMMSTNGTLVAESQLLLHPIAEHPSLETDEAYCYGIGVRRQDQNKGYASLLHRTHEQLARQQGKRRITLTVRVENAASIRSFLKEGYQVVGYNPTCYGPYSEGGARLIMEKDLIRPTPKWDKQEDIDLVQVTGIAYLESPSEQTPPGIISFPVQSGDEVDHRAHQLVSDLLSKGYKGTGLLRPDEIDQKESLFIFAKI